MTTWQIYHVATRVLLQQTTDQKIVDGLPARFAAQVVPDDAALPPPPVGKTGKGWWTLLADGAYSEATPEERNAAFTSPERPESKAVLDAGAALVQRCADLAADAATPAKFKPFFLELREFMLALGVIYRNKPRLGD